MTTYELVEEITLEEAVALFEALKTTNEEDDED